MKFALPFVALLALPLLSFSQAQEAQLLSQWTDPTITPTSWLNGRFNDIWGMAINGKEFAIIGSTAGMHFIDVSDPEDISEVEAAFVPGAAQGPDLVHRDFKNFGKYLYAVADEGQSTLQIIDMSYLPDSTHIVYNSNTLLKRTHNVYIDTLNARLYACGPTLNSGGASLRILSLSDPENPTILGTYPNGALDLPYVHDAYVRDHVAYLNCGNEGFWVVDFTDPQNPQVLGTMTSYVQSGYNHSGWLNTEGDYYFLADETHGKDIKSVAVSDLGDINVAETFDATSPEQKSIPHNLLMRDNLLYVSYYYDGLQVFDLSDPLNPERVAYYDTYAGVNNGSYQGAWGVYPFLPSGIVLISDMQGGLFVFEKIELLSGLSESKKTASGARVFPQPSTGTATLEFSWHNPAGECRIGLFHPDGREVFRKDDIPVGQGFNRIEIELPQHLSNGLYFLKMEGTGIPLLLWR